MKRLLIFILTIIFVFNNFCDNSKLHVYTIPGLNGLGSDNEYVKKLLGNDIEITEVQRPEYPFADLGQRNCVAYLQKAVQADKSNNIIIHATSQGTATGLNYLAYSNGNKQIKALILEGVLSSGNSAILHTAKSTFPALSKLRFSYYWGPYLAKYKLPFYWPFGNQAIRSCVKISTDIPIIIIHSKEDPQISYTDACALYYCLVSNGNKNVYLISENGFRHTNILETEEKINTKDNIVQQILRKYNLVDEKIRIYKDLTIYQPDYKQFKSMYEDLISREKNHERIGYCLKGGVLCSAIYGLYIFIKKFLIKK